MPRADRPRVTHVECRICHERLPRSEFPVRENGSVERTCKACKKERREGWGKGVDPSGTQAPKTKCRKCGKSFDIYFFNMTPSGTRDSACRRCTGREAMRGRMLASEARMHERMRPKTRSDCIDGPRPCPWVSCRHHLWLEVSSNGKSVTYTPGDDDMPSCALDAAEVGGMDGGQIGRIMGISRERIRQIGESAMANFAASTLAREIAPPGVAGERGKR